VNMDCYNKIVTFNVAEGKKAKSKGERRIILGCIISTMTVRKLLRKGCQAYLSYVRDSEKHGKELKDIPIVREYQICSLKSCQDYLQDEKWNFL